MAESALCRYHCPNCDAELEQLGYMIIEGHDDEPARLLLSGQVNVVECSNCGTPTRLNMPLLYHDGLKELFIIYVPGLSGMSQEELAETIRYPYGMVVTAEAERRGIELPEPDDAAFPRGEEEEYRNVPGAKFHALTQEQAEELLPVYLLRPTIVDNFDVLQTAVQAVNDGMSGQEVVDDMARLQLINTVIAASDPIAVRKVLHHNEPYLNDELYEVIDTLSEQMTADGNTEMVAQLKKVRDSVVRYKQSQQQRLKARKTASAKAAKPKEEETSSQI
jgi:hypothetical protein